MTLPQDDLTDQQLERYARHLVLPQVHEQGQLRLMAAKVGIIGLGGLGCPVAQSLAASGVGELRLIDPDLVDLSNLQRQSLHTTADIGKPKVQSAAQKIAALNPEVRVDARQLALESGKAQQLLSGLDLVIDGCDNGPTRLATAHAAEALGIPLVSGAIYQFEGQISAFRPYLGTGHPRLTEVFPGLAEPVEGQACADVGVFSPLCQVVGGIMASEAMKLIIGIEPNLDGKLMLMDLRDLQIRVFSVS